MKHLSHGAFAAAVLAVLTAGAAVAQAPASPAPAKVEAGPAFVSRGGQKLANALEATGIEVAARRCLDVGASTGGFSDCLLQAGARQVIAVEVGYGQLAARLRGDPRVHILERTNIRSPLDGVVINRKLEVGQTVQSSQSIATLFVVPVVYSLLRVRPPFSAAAGDLEEPA